MDNLRNRFRRFFLGKHGFFLSFSLSALILLIYLLQMFEISLRVNGNDFTSYLLSSEALLHGKNPYDTVSPFPFIYPLFLCVALIPLTILPYWLSNLIWFALNLTALYASFFIILKLYLRSLSFKEITALFIVPLFILVSVIQSNVLNGQVNFIVLFLCVLFLKYYTESNKLLASMFLSAAISIKLTPLIFIIYLLFRKEFLWAFFTLVFSVFLMVILPYTIAGDKTLSWYSHYLQSFIVRNIAFRNEASEDFSFSITSIIDFFIPTVPEFISLIIAAFISLAPVIWLQLTSKKINSFGHLLIFDLYMLAILLISPKSEAHHLINLLPALSILIVATLFRSTTSEWRFGVLVLIIIWISEITERFHSAINLISIFALYISNLYLYFRDRESTIALNC